MATGDQWVFTKQREAQPVITMTAPGPDQGITFHCEDTTVLQITKDGFYVRGVRATADDKEAEEVYNCFKEWLAWSTLNRY